MDEEEIFEKIKELISNQFGIEQDTIKLDSTFTDDLAADSLDIVEFVMGVEEEFDIQIPDEESDKIITVEDMVKYISSVV